MLWIVIILIIYLWEFSSKLMLRFKSMTGLKQHDDRLVLEVGPGHTIRLNKMVPTLLCFIIIIFFLQIIVGGKFLLDGGEYL